LRAAARAVRRGQIVAVKGLGGFHLIAAAHDEPAVRRLRKRKHREEKPFALMFPSLESVKAECEVSPLEERLLRSPEAPIVLLRRLPFSILHPPSSLSRLIAPDNPNLGAMLPYTPLHHLLLAELGFPVIATSGNLSDEPICTDEREALERLHGIADVFLVHSRPIVRHVDDSMVRVMLDRELVLRRARGYAPLPITIGGVLSAKAHPHTAPVFSLASPKGGEGRGEEAQGFPAQIPPPQPSPRSGGERETGAVSSCAHHRGVVELRPPKTVLAVGAHLKNSVALAVGRQVFISQHIGDLETEPAYAAFRHVIADFEKLYEAAPQMIAADFHPDYLSTKFALELNSERGGPHPQHSVTQSTVAVTAQSPANLSVAAGDSRAPQPQIVRVQHHIAHVLSCLAENEIAPPALGVSWDGTGYGLDGTVWGGEFFVVTDKDVARMTHLRPFRLPGGDKAVKEPRRTAIGLLYEVFGGQVFERNDLAPVAAFSAPELAALKTMLVKQLNSPVTTSAGRLFDAVAALVNLRQQIRFEGQAAMELEFAIAGVETEEVYPMQSAECGVRSECAGAPKNPPPRVLDWSPMVEAILADVKNGLPIAIISARFHNALTEAIVAVAKQAGLDRVVLSGGCFQNRYLLERTVRRLQTEGFRPGWHQRVPPNDGGIALGQVIAALRSND
jgi:hydrogenase maturation protein HypF